jgi:hypothetical protein
MSNLLPVQTFVMSLSNVEAPYVECNDLVVHAQLTPLGYQYPGKVLVTI